MIRIYDLLLDALEIDKYKDKWIGKTVGLDKVLDEIGIVWVKYPDYCSRRVVKKNQCVCNAYHGASTMYKRGIIDIVMYRPGWQRQLHIILERCWGSLSKFKIVQVYSDFNVNVGGRWTVDD